MHLATQQLHLGIYPREMKAHVRKKTWIRLRIVALFTTVKLETGQVFTTRRRAKNTGMFTQRNKKERTTDIIYNNMNESHSKSLY